MDPFFRLAVADGGADDLAGLGVDDQHPVGTRNVEALGGGVDGDVVPATVASNGKLIDEFKIARGRQGRRGFGEPQERKKANERENRSSNAEGRGFHAGGLA